MRMKSLAVESIACLYEGQRVSTLCPAGLGCRHPHCSILSQTGLLNDVDRVGALVRSAPHSTSQTLVTLDNGGQHVGEVRS